MRRSLSCTGRITTFVSLIFLVTFSFVVVLFPSSFQHSQALHSLYKRGPKPKNTSVPTPGFVPHFPTIGQPPPTPSSTTALPPSSTFSTTHAIVSPSPTPTSSSDTPPADTSETTIPVATSSQVTTTTPSFTPQIVTSTSSTTYSAPSTSTSGGLLVSQLPQTTFFATNSIPDPAISSSSEASLPSTTSTQQASHAFFSNKGAVAGTFTVVSFIILALFIGAAVMLLKKRNAWESADDTYFDKYVPQDNGSGTGAGVADGTFDDPESHMTEAMAPAVNAYPDRQIHFGDIGLQQSDDGMYSDYGLGYPPGAVYSPPQESSQGGSHYPEAYDGQARESATPPTESQSSTYTLTRDPPNASNTAFAPPVSFRQPGARGSGYDPSIDSFYGAYGADDSSVTHAY